MLSPGTFVLSEIGHELVDDKLWLVVIHVFDVDGEVEVTLERGRNAEVIGLNTNLVDLLPLPIQPLDQDNLARDGINFETPVVCQRILANSVANLAVGSDVGVHCSNPDDFLADGSILRDPDGEVPRRTDELGGVVIEIL